LDFFIVLALSSSLKQQYAIDKSLHLDTFSWFRANHSLLLFLNVVCIA